MSRIAGVVCLDLACPTKEEHRTRVEEICALQDHVGSNQQSLVTIGPACFGHTRIEAFDPGGVVHQAMCHGNGSLSVAYNGLVYNSAHLRDELRAKGHQFRSETDAEVILHAFSEWGEESAKRLLGMFSFAMYDHEKEAVYLVRDRFGQKPLYYTIVHEHVFFASELRTVARIRPALRLNKLCLLEWSLYRNLASEETFFQDIYAVRPGHLVRVRRDGVEARAYFFPTDYVDSNTYERFGAAPEAAVIAELEAALANGVQDCLIGAVPAGTLCSGGVDSSLVTLLATRSVRIPMAFHASTSDHGALEKRSDAEAVTKALGIRLLDCPIDKKIFHRELPRVIYFNGMPLANNHLVAFFLTAQLARENGIRVLLTGDAADGQFGGLWHRHRRQKQLFLAKSLFARLPRRVRNALGLAAGLCSGMPVTTIGCEELIPDTVQAIDRYVRTESRLRLERAYEFVPDQHVRSILATMVEDFMDSWDLERSDRLGMATGVECRHPFAHPGVVSLSFNLPVPYRFRRFTDKWLVKQIAGRHLP